MQTKNKTWDIISSNLKPLNKKAEKTFFKIIKGITPNNPVNKIGEEGQVFMQVIAEQIYHNNQYGKVYAIGHYYQQNGDRMSDPEMTFLVNEADNRVYPLSFEQHGFFARYEENCVFDEEGKLDGIYRKRNNEHKNFANQWMENIKHQQSL